jgi:hypothetical protein
VPQEAVFPGGILAALGVGDLVQIHGQEILRKRFISDREARWQWDNVPLSGISIPEKARSGCTSPTVVAPDAGVSPNRARRRAGGSGDYSGSVSTGRIFVPGCQCSGTVCDCR